MADNDSTGAPSGGAAELARLADMADAIHGDTLKMDTLLTAIDRISFYAAYDGMKDDFEAVRHLAAAVLDVAGDSADKAEELRDALRAQACIGKAARS